MLASQRISQLRRDLGRRLRRRRLVVALMCAASLLGGLASPVASAGGLPGAAVASGPRSLVVTQGPAKGTDVQLTSRTIVVPPATVKSSLSSVNGATYTFANDNGVLAQAAPGKVLLLEGTDAVVVQTVKHVGAKLVVTTTPANLTDVIQSGQIKASSAPDTAAAEGVPLAGERAAPGPAMGFSGGPVGFAGPARRYDSAGFSYQGNSGGFSYKVTFAKRSDGLHAKAEICYQLVASSSGSSCGNGLSINVMLDGVFTWGNEEVDLGVGGGSIRSGSFSISNMSSQINLNYTVLRGEEPKIGADPPVLKIPFAFEAPLCGSPIGCGGLPLYSKFELAILIKLGISSKNSTVEGGVKLTIGGSPKISGGGILGGVSGSIAGPHVKGSFTPGAALTPGSAGIEVALQNKFGVGLGIRGINGLYYISAITAVGETTGSLVAGQACKSYVGAFTINGNFEAQLFGFKVASPAKQLFQKKATFKEPGC